MAVDFEFWRRTARGGITLSVLPETALEVVAEVDRLRAEQFDEYAICVRLAAVTEGANWGGRGPNYTAKEKAVIEALQGVARDQGWETEYEAETGRWVAKPTPAPQRKAPQTEGETKL